MNDILKKLDVDCLLVNSTNEFLEEYTPLDENSRYFLTGFTGSTGDALLTKDAVYLFVDGRYHAQAHREVKENVTVMELQTGQLFLDELVKRIPNGATLGVFSRKNTQNRVEKLREKVNVKLIAEDSFEKPKQESVFCAEKVSGLATEDKVKKIGLNEGEALIVTNLEEVSYLFNLRDFSRDYSSKIKAKAVVFNDRAVLFEKNNEFEEFVKNLKDDVFVDKSTISAYDYWLAQNPKELKSPIAAMKSTKTDEEIAHYKEAFARTDKTMQAIMDYIENNENISEYDISQELQTQFLKNSAKSLSFKPIVAKDKNSALAHYSKSSKDEILQDGSLVLIDCGAYYEQGLATDITRVFVKGRPSELQKKVYTIVLKAFLHAFNSDKATGFEIDGVAREVFERNPIQGFEFCHGLGHGLGISVHEYPPNLSKNEIAKTEIQDGMCFTIEPGLYNQDYFGVRLENACYKQGGKIHSFSKMGFEEKLIDFELLTVQEKDWLKQLTL